MTTPTLEPLCPWKEPCVVTVQEPVWILQPVWTRRRRLIYVLLNDTASYPNHVTSNDMISESLTGKDVEESGHGLTLGTVPELPGGPKWNHKDFGQDSRYPGFDSDLSITKKKSERTPLQPAYSTWRWQVTLALPEIESWVVGPVSTHFTDWVMFS
jgi:hypothetical protein